MIPIYPCIHRVLNIGGKSTGSRPDRARVQNFKYSRVRAWSKKTCARSSLVEVRGEPKYSQCISNCELWIEAHCPSYHVKTLFSSNKAYKNSLSLFKNSDPPTTDISDIIILPFRGTPTFLSLINKTGLLKIVSMDTIG